VSCSGAIPQLVEFHEKYAKKGLSVLMMSVEDKETLGTYVADEKIPFPVGSAPKKAFAALDIRGIPQSFLIGGSGRILWSGHPSKMKAAQIEQALKELDRVEVGDVAAPLAPAKADVERGRYADAARKAQAVLAAPAPDAEKTDARTILDAVRMVADLKMKRIDAALAESRDLDAIDLLRFVQDRFAGLEAGKTAKAREAELREKPALKRELEAADALEQLDRKEAAAAKVSDSKALIPQYAALAKQYEGTVAAKRAARQARMLSKLEDE
jgi:hypothetical protein